MKHTTTTAGLAVSWLLMTGLGSASAAQGGVDFGKSEFETSCASCHGASGKGDGVRFRHFSTPPADLTTLAKRNGGVFPFQRVWDTVDGRTEIENGPHGTRDMPVWGLVYRAQAQDTPHPPDWYARNRLAALLDYLARIQEK